MAEELQGILERIQKDGIEKADNEAAQIIAKAKEQAAEITAKAAQEAEALLKKADSDSAAFQQRAEKAIEQAARDVVISVGDAVTETLRSIVEAANDSSLKSDDFPAFIKKIVQAYVESSSPDSIELLVSEEDQERITKYFMTEMTDAMRAGLTISGDHSIISGFVVSLKDKSIYHDFSGETLTDAMSDLLRPQLAEIVKKAVAGLNKKSSDKND